MHQKYDHIPPHIQKFLDNDKKYQKTTKELQQEEINAAFKRGDELIEECKQIASRKSTSGSIIEAAASGFVSANMFASLLFLIFVVIVVIGVLITLVF